VKLEVKLKWRCNISWRKVNYVPIEEVRMHDHKLLTFSNINTLKDLKAAEEISGQQ